MSKEAIEKQLIEPFLEAVSGGGAAGKDRRKEYQALKGQYFVFDPDNFKSITKSFLLEYMDSDKAASQAEYIMKDFILECEKKEEGFHKTDQLRWSELHESRPKMANSKVYIVASYAAVEDLKIKWSRFIYDSSMRKFDVKKVTTDYNIGHGEYGVAVSGYQTARGLAKLQELSATVSPDGKAIFDEIFTRANTISRTFVNEIGVEFEHTQVVNSDGTLKKEHRIKLSLQHKDANNKDSHGEKAAFNFFKEKVTA